MKVKMQREFEVETEMMDVTSIDRPDITWRHTDTGGHVHQYWVDNVPAESYDPSKHYTVPTLIWVVDSKVWDPDFEFPRELGHYECPLCQSKVFPARTSDETRQFVPGLTHYTIDGRSVSKEEFMREYKKDYDALHS